MQPSPRFMLRISTHQKQENVKNKLSIINYQVPLVLFNKELQVPKGENEPTPTSKFSVGV